MRALFFVCVLSLLFSVILLFTTSPVIATARDGRDALEKITQYHPDIITLDLEMPTLDGLEVISQLMREHPLPIIVITGTTDVSKPFEALKRGAIDFVRKPSGSISLDIEIVRAELLTKLHAASHVQLFKPNLLTPSPNLQNSQTSSLPHITTLPSNTANLTPPASILFTPTSKKVIVIAASTGGPQTLERLLCSMPKNIPAPILIVQHMPEHFTQGLAERLQLASGFKVREAQAGDILVDGEVLLAPGNYHMEVYGDVLHANGAVLINQLPSELGVRPNANRLFNSAANLYRERTIGIVLTGMGSDGTEGCRTIKKFHGVVIAQKESSCIVYGMPKSVVDNQLADLILSLEDIPAAIIPLLDV